MVLEDGFANGCEGATVHGIEMNHISNNYSGTFAGGPRRWFGYCVCVWGGGDGYIFRSVYSLLHTSWYHVSNLNDCLGDMSLS